MTISKTTTAAEARKERARRLRYQRPAWRRDSMLEQYARGGGDVKGLYTYDIGIGGTGDEPKG